MPRYFFNVYDGQDIFDNVGTELTGVREMRLHMVSTALEIMRKDEHQKDIWQMEALDKDGKIVGTMEFGVAEENGLR